MKTDRQTIVREKQKTKERLKKQRDKRYGEVSVKDMLAMERLLFIAKQIIYS